MKALATESRRQGKAFFSSPCASVAIFFHGKDNGKLPDNRQRQRHALVGRFRQGVQVFHRQPRYPTRLAIAREHNRTPITAPLAPITPRSGCARCFALPVPVKLIDPEQVVRQGHIWSAPHCKEKLSQWLLKSNASTLPIKRPALG